MRQLTDLTEKSIGWFNDIADMCQRLTTGNVSHMSATIRGKAIRCAEYLNKHKEKPVSSIWHDAKEEPEISRKLYWKPTEEQIVALRWVLNNVPYNKHKEEISELLDQIKDL